MSEKVDKNVDLADQDEVTEESRYIPRKTFSIKTILYDFLQKQHAKNNPSEDFKAMVDLIEKIDAKPKMTKLDKQMLKAYSFYRDQLADLSLTKIFFAGIESLGFPYKSSDDVEEALGENDNKLEILKSIASNKVKFNSLGVGKFYGINFGDIAEEIKDLEEAITIPTL